MLSVNAYSNRQEAAMANSALEAVNHLNNVDRTAALVSEFSDLLKYLDDNLYTPTIY